jgi:hypothetical protein
MANKPWKTHKIAKPNARVTNCEKKVTAVVKTTMNRDEVTCDRCNFTQEVQPRRADGVGQSIGIIPPWLVRSR